MAVDRLGKCAQHEDIHSKTLIEDIDFILKKKVGGCEFWYSQLWEIESLFESICLNSHKNNDERFNFDKSRSVGTFTLDDWLTLKFKVSFKHQLNFESCGCFYDKIYFEFFDKNLDFEISDDKKQEILVEFHDFLRKYTLSPTCQDLKNEMLINALWLDLNKEIHNLKESIYNVFFDSKSINWTEPCLRDNVLKILQKSPEDINKNINVSDDKIVYHFEKLDVIFSFKSDWKSFHSISYEFLVDDLSDGKKYEVLYGFFKHITPKIEGYDMWYDS